MVQLPIWIFYKFQSLHNDQPTSLKSAFFEPQYILNISALYSHWQIWIPCLKFLSLEKSRSNCKVVKDYSQVSPWLSGKQNCNRLERQRNRKWRAKTQGCINLIILKYWDIPQYQVQCFKHKTLKKKNRWGKRQTKKKTNMICFSGNHSSVINTDRKTRSFLERTVRTVTTSH